MSIAININNQIINISREMTQVELISKNEVFTERTLDQD